MRVHGVLESCLYAADLAASETFYRDVIGLQLISRVEGRHVFFRCGRGVVLLFNPDHTASEQTTVGGAIIPLHGSRGPGHLAFSVDEAELPAWRDHLKQHKIAVESAVNWPRGGKSIYFRDPAGNSIELASPELWGK